MPVEQVVDLGRLTMREVFVLASPILAAAVLVSLLVNIVQVLTSLQETTISTVPRLLACCKKSLCVCILVSCIAEILKDAKKLGFADPD